MNKKGKIKKIFEMISRNKFTIIVIACVILFTTILINQLIGILFKAQLLQDPCSLCDSYLASKNIPINLSIFNIGK